MPFLVDLQFMYRKKYSGTHVITMATFLPQQKAYYIFL